MELRVGGDVWTPHLMIKDNPKGNDRYYGAVWNLITEIGNILNVSLIVTKDNWGVQLSNGTWTGLLGRLKRKELDLLLGPMEATYERSKEFDFGSPIHISSMVIVVKRPESEGVIENFINPFSLMTWLALIASIFGVGILRYILDHILCKLNENYDVSNRHSLCTHIWNSFRVSVFQGLDKKNNSDSFKLLSTFWYLSIFMLMMCYTAVLRSYLTLEENRIPIKNIQDLANHKSILPVIAATGSMKSWFMNGIQDNIVKIRKKVENDKYGQYEDCFSSMHLVTQKNRALLCEKETIQAMLAYDFMKNGKCSMYIAEEAVRSSILTFMFNKDSNWTNIINKQIRRVTSAGLYQNWMETETNFSTTLCQEKIDGATVKKRTFKLEDVYGPFLLWFTGMTASIVAFIVESIIKYNTCVKEAQKR